MANVEEIWLPINNCTGYEISNTGRVKRVGTNKGQGYPKKDRIIRGSFSFGYPRVSIRISGIVKTLKKHRLVAEHFIPNPENKDTVNHIDGNKQNNNYKNLEWCTFAENTNHAYKEGLKNAKGSYNGRSKITESQVIEIRNSKLKGVELAKMYGLHPQMISLIRTRKFWKHIP